MEYTEYYQFRKPTKAVDIVKVGDINFNSEKIDELIHSTQVSLAPAYDATRTSSNPYMTGDVVMKDALMYKCLEDDVYGAWDATKWERTTAGEEGAGGSDIEPNPQGTPTEDLDKIGINGTIYNIAGSGGGGTALILDAQIYSTEERVVGVWIDNKPLYAKTIELSSEATISYNSWTSLGILANTLDIETYVNCNAINSVGVVWNDVDAGTFNGYICLCTGRNGDTITAKYVNLWYTKTTDTAGSGGYQAYGFSPIIYSTEEREVGVWKDNKPLYAKTVNILAYPSNTTAVDIPHGIADIDTVSHYEAHARWASGAMVVIPNAQVNNGSIIASASFDCTVNKTNITLRVGTDRSAVSGEVTIWYTKTTDTAGSGSYNTLGVPMVHYSTDEQVVGTWIDGKTLYVRAFDYVVENGATTILANCGFETLVKIEGYVKYLTFQDPLPYSDSSDYVLPRIDGGDFKIQSSAFFVNKATGTVVAYYTKSST